MIIPNEIRQKKRRSARVVLLLLVFMLLFASSCGVNSGDVSGQAAESQSNPAIETGSNTAAKTGDSDLVAGAGDSNSTAGTSDAVSSEISREGQEAIDRQLAEEKAAEEREALLASIDPNVKIGDKTPFSIQVNRLANCVTVYTLDDSSEYTIPVKAMVCSAGREGHESPLGDYKINDFKADWCYMVDGSYGQYATGWRSGGYLFHSACYTKQSKDSLMTDEYNMLGENASLGCIRLQVADAKWIYDNCMIGTPVTIYEDENPGPLGKPETVIPYIDEAMANGWDPTDPDEANPWKSGHSSAD